MTDRASARTGRGCLTATEIEGVESFRRRAREWLADNLPPLPEPDARDQAERSDDDELQFVRRHRALQRRLFDGGFAGICFPAEYGGLGLTPAHAAAFTREVADYEYPNRIQIPTFSPCATVLLEFGTEAQKHEHIPAMLRGDELWTQLLSEPSGGSDVAGALTSAVRDGDEWTLNGSKIWTSGAWFADWGLCLARTNWNVPKHSGLTVFILPLNQPGVEIHRIEMIDGSKEFCQEFFTDVPIPDADRVGDVDDGWTVGRRWMYHERSLGATEYVIRPPGTRRGLQRSTLVETARDVDRLDDPATRELIGEDQTLALAVHHLRQRIPDAIACGALNEQAASLVKLMGGVVETRRASIAFELAGSSAATWKPDTGSAGPGTDYLMRQRGAIGGGTTEMARNVVSERALGMPRDTDSFGDVAFRDVPRGTGSSRK